MQDLFGKIRKVAPTDSTVLIQGESGTGKELVARALHNLSKRAKAPLISVNCAAIPETLLESELFGHVRGAFTGAVASKKGILEEADGGTVFLDEIGDMSLALQAKLLRVLEEQAIRPVGSTKTTQVNIRFITATNKDLKAAVRGGAFREDLYYRINVISLEIPPLRARKGDVELLVKHYLRKYSDDMGRQVKDITSGALALLMDYGWPGNVRELQNVIERAILISDGDLIQPEHLPQGVKAGDEFTRHSSDRKLSIEEYTKQFIKEFQGQYNEKQLAELLGITRKSLWEKRKKWGIAKD
ncbi:MAG TPA: hypothetical protein DCS05_02770 [Nitrospiraceae bacterium]|nr:hypothetical protein [Nitrospiraceae bacterium]